MQKMQRKADFAKGIYAFVKRLQKLSMSIVFYKRIQIGKGIINVGATVKSGEYATRLLLSIMKFAPKESSQERSKPLGEMDRTTVHKLSSKLEPYH